MSQLLYMSVLVGSEGVMGVTHDTHSRENRESMKGIPIVVYDARNAKE